jgi:adenylate cyclase
MKACAVCGYSLPAESRFCPRCGTALGLECGACRAENNPLAIHCGQCGVVLRTPEVESALPSRTPRESRRIVTVLFADIVGYTSLVESRSEQTEVVRGLLQEWFQALSKDILDHGGIVEKFIGDAICALFGAPAVHEDDPQRALSCALSMQQTVERMNREQEAAGEDRATIQLRIGVATGEVVGGTAQQAGQEQYSVTGDAVNTASRLQTTAQPGQILVSSSTEQLTRDQFLFESAGTLTLKGKRIRVRAFVLVERRRESERSDGELVGRERELGHLGYCLRRAAEGDAQLIEIAGDAGVGKSRLVEAFTEQSRAIALVSRGDCPTDMATPLHPFIAISRGLKAATSAVEDDGLAEALAALDGTAGSLLAMGESEGEDVARALKTVIGELSKTGPVVLIIENVHRADPDSVDVLQRLIAQVGNERLLLLWTRRAGEELVIVGDIIAEYTRMPLRPLNDEDARSLMVQLLDGTEIAEALADRIVERSGGNPLYIEAMVRAIRDEGEAFEGSDTVGNDIPTTVRGLVQARLDSLPESERLTAQEAAVAGRDFDGRLLQEVDLFGIDVEAALESLTRRGMIDRVGGTVYRFRHVLTQEVCYDTMLQALRSELHREIADAVAELYPDRTLELAPYRADHYAKAGDTERAVDVLVEAGVSEA